MGNEGRRNLLVVARAFLAVMACMFITGMRRIGHLMKSLFLLLLTCLTSFAADFKANPRKYINLKIF